MGIEAAVRGIGVPVSTTYITGGLTTLLEALATRRRFSAAENSALGGLLPWRSGAPHGSRHQRASASSSATRSHPSVAPGPDHPNHARQTGLEIERPIGGSFGCRTVTFPDRLAIMHTRKTHHMASSITEPRSTLSQLVCDIRNIVVKELTPAQTSGAVAKALDPYLDSDDLLTQADRAASDENYLQHVLHVEPDGSFSIVSLVWLPGQRTPIHDHVSWCVVGVYEGEETEVQYRLDGTGEGRRLVETTTGINSHGSTCGFAPPGDLHEVWNAGDSKAISMHVYGADIRRLGSSIRRQYDFPVMNA